MYILINSNKDICKKDFSFIFLFISFFKIFMLKVNVCNDNKKIHTQTHTYTRISMHVNIYM